jgi:citrate synthase
MLGVRMETFYTYVSRGLIKTIKNDGKRSKLYRKSDVQSLRSRAAARVGGPKVSSSLRYGAPIAQTWISEITPSGPLYRGTPALEVAKEGRSFEAVAELLWTGMPRASDIPWKPFGFPPELSLLLNEIGTDAGRTSMLRSFAAICSHFSDFENAGCGASGDTVAQGRMLLQAFAGAAGLLGAPKAFSPPRRGELIAACLARGFGLADDGAEVRAINAALVLSAEHELAAPTFVARICASTGADLFACVGSALMAHSGPMQVGGCLDVEAVLDRILEEAATAEQFLPSASRQSIAELPCFSHPLYDRDPRSGAILEMIGSLNRPRAVVGPIMNYIEAVARQGAYPNIFASTVILARVLGLPPGRGAMLNTLARTAGWIAHVMEQRVAGTMLRPRAKYMGKNPIW